MKQNLSFLLVSAFFFTAVSAQEGKVLSGYAITPAEKGQSGWKEIRLLDFTTGETIKTIYSTGQDITILNARTGKPVVKKNIEPAIAKAEIQDHFNYTIQPAKDNRNATNLVMRIRKEPRAVDPGLPFATNSAAMAYDKKHDRIYYTPMGINQLRYIDLKAKSPKLYYFEDESFGTVSGRYDMPNQITRMVIGSNGNGYALTNSADHLIQFTTGKRPVITDLGALADVAFNENISIHDRQAGGGDMIADAAGNLYLITANRRVYKIIIDTREAIYVGSIRGLPAGYSTNGAMVEEGSKVIVCSAESTVGYFRFDLLTLLAEKVSTATSVFNASDLANGILAFDTKKDKKETPALETITRPVAPQQTIVPSGITVYPNPVTDGQVRISFINQPSGKYQVQLMTNAGQVISSNEVEISNKSGQTSFRLPETIAKGTYLLKIVSDINKISKITTLIVQ